MASMPMAVDNAEKFEKVVDILNRHARRPSGLIPILQAIQHEYLYLPEEVLTYVATSLSIPAARVYGVATFYAHFALKPKGKHVIRICDGTACHVKQSLPVLDALRKKLGTTEKSKTTSDHDVHGGDGCLPGRLRIGAGHCGRRAGLRPDHAGARRGAGGGDTGAGGGAGKSLSPLSSSQPECVMDNLEGLTFTPAAGKGISTLAQVRRVIICAGTGCMANGAMKVFEQFKSEMAAQEFAGDSGTARRGDER